MDIKLASAAKLVAAEGSRLWVSMSDPMKVGSKATYNPFENSLHLGISPTEGQNGLISSC